MPRPCLLRPSSQTCQDGSCGHRHVVALMLGGGLLYSWGSIDMVNRLGGKKRQMSISTTVLFQQSCRLRAWCDAITWPVVANFTVALGETVDDRFLGLKEGRRLPRKGNTQVRLYGARMIRGSHERKRDPDTPTPSFVCEGRASLQPSDTRQTYLGVCRRQPFNNVD